MKDVSPFAPDPLIFFFHTQKNILVHKLQGPLADKWFILKTLNIVRRKQFLLFPQLGIWTLSRHFSLNQAQGSPSGVLANWWDLPHKNLITLPKQKAGFILKVSEQIASIFSNLFENIIYLKKSFSLPHLSNVLANVFSCISSIKHHTPHLLLPEFTRSALDFWNKQVPSD